MFQNWITVAGLGLDLLGFILLLREWWLAFFHETAVLEAERRRAWERSLRHHQSTHASDQLRSHLDTSHRIHDEMAERAAQGRHEATLKSRKAMFVLATVLIVAGAVLQIIGALPIAPF
jgi:ferric-dicitrate binding protein FerR (iron transport regulator)